MKIYVDNYNPSKIKLHHLEKHLIYSDRKLSFLSEEGIFTIKDDALFEIKEETNSAQIATKCINNYLDNIDIVVDNSIEELKLVYSLPYEHFKMETLVFTYKLLNVNLIVICTNKENAFKDIFKKEQLNIIDFYFETNCSNIFDCDFKKTINEFLSLLN